MATATEAARAEQRAAMAAIEPMIAGLVNYLRIDLTPETRAKVQALLDEYNSRHAALDTAQRGNDGLLGNLGYPDVPKSTVIADIFANLQQELAETQAAFGQFLSESEATAAQVTIGPETAQTAKKASK